MSRSKVLFIKMIQLEGFKILSINTIEQRMLTQTIKISVHFYEGVTTFRKFAVSYTLK